MTPSLKDVSNNHINRRSVKNEAVQYSKQTTIRGAVVEQSGRSRAKPSAEDEALESPS
jgi:hypothetical protein